MKKIKIDSNYILIGTFLLITGLVLGISIGMGGTFALEGGAQTVVTSATSTNATGTNATPVNATGTNATGANASRTDNILYLNNFSLAVESAKPGDKVYVGKMTTGACNSGMSISFIEMSNNRVKHFAVNVENMNGTPYFIVPKNVESGSYTADTITLIGLNSDNTTFSRCYARVTAPAACSKHNFAINLKISRENNKDIKLEKISLGTDKALIGEKVKVTYNTDETLTSMKLIFKDGDKTLNVNVLDLDKDAYFTIPSTTSVGEYNLTKVVLMSEDNSTVYEKGQNFSTDVKIAVSDNDKKTYVYNNSDINEEIIKKLYDDNNIEEIVVNVDENTTISEDLFKVIIGTNRKLVINTNNNQIVFNGRDVTETKAIDVAMNTTRINEDDDISKLVNDGIVVNFVSNGNLPGNALIRLRTTSTVKNTLGNKKAYVYYYDEEANGFNVIAENVSPKNDYYEFAISHNSKYILTNSKLSNNLIISEEDNNVVGFRQSDNSYLLMLSGALILILIVIIIILVIKNKKREN